MVYKNLKSSNNIEWDVMFFTGIEDIEWEKVYRWDVIELNTIWDVVTCVVMWDEEWCCFYLSVLWDDDHYGFDRDLWEVWDWKKVWNIYETEEFMDLK